jgi:hypothetical protein
MWEGEQKVEIEDACIIAQLKSCLQASNPNSPHACFAPGGVLYHSTTQQEVQSEAAVTAVLPVGLLCCKLYTSVVFLSLWL